MKKIENNLLNIYIIFNIFIIYLCSCFYFHKWVTYKDFSRFYIVLLLINIIMIVISFIKNKFKSKIYDFYLLLIIIFGIISSIFSIHSDIAIFGFKGRYEGLLSLLYYYSLFVLSSFVSKNKKIIVYSIILGGVVEAIYGVFQLFDVSFIKVLHHAGNIWVTGFTNNPNFYATIMLINLGYSLGLFIESDTLIKKIIYTVLIILFLFCLLISNTSSCAVGLIGIVFYLIIYCIKNKKVNYLLWILILILNITVLTSQFGKTTLIHDLVKSKNEAIDIINGDGKYYYGTKRIKVWEETLKIVPKNIVHGVGIDNFYYAFGEKPLIIGFYYYDKVHNEYLQILITEGIFALISYLCFYSSVVLDFFNNKKRNVYLLLPVIGYLIQAFFNISVIEIAPIFFICLGLLVDRNNDNHIIYKKYFKRLFDIIFSIIMIIALLPLNLIISLLIKLEDGGNIFYVQKRTGRNGKEFNILKFRTMEYNKVTKIGKFLRKTSFDEIPQFINILLGDMSLIGPRPWIVDYYKVLTKKQRKRFEVRPGILGLAQVNGRNRITIFEKIDYDLEYVNSVSLIVDLKILFKSFYVIFKSDDISDMDKYIKNELKELRLKNKIDKK